jgi:hypothetical protein
MRSTNGRRPATGWTVNGAPRSAGKHSTSRPPTQEIQRPLGDRRADRVLVVSRRDVAMMHGIERFILAYDGDDLLHDIEITFPGASYRAFFLALRRAQAFIAKGAA